MDTTPPNTRYEVKNLGVLSSNPNENTLNLDDFLFGCCHETGYYGASIGSTITIKDGTYNISVSSKYYGNEKIDPDKILAKVNLDAIAFEDDTETVNVYMTYNKDGKVKDFLGGNELAVYIEIYRNGDNDYEIYDDDISVEI